ncbi:MAG: AAA family ATPase [Verrucomicrobiae bacterium]|nr:AAA family ATPase [Verrucomicrobiae bacterium]
MTEELRKLIEWARADSSLELFPIQTPAELLAELRGDVALLESLLKAPEAMLRRIALQACGEGVNPLLMPVIEGLLRDPDCRVRAELAKTAGRFDAERGTELLRVLIRDEDGDVRIEAVRVASGRPALVEELRRMLREDPSWTVRQAAVPALAAAAPGTGFADLLAALAREKDEDVVRACGDCSERILTDHSDAVAEAALDDTKLFFEVAAVLERFGHSWLRLKTWIAGKTATRINLAALVRFGTDLTASALAGSLGRSFNVDEPLQILLQRFRCERPRSIALLGKSGVGKTALVNELVRGLWNPENGGWRVIRMSPTDFVAGTRYSGEWETKLAELVRLISRPRKVLLYVPNLSDLSAVGRWSGSNNNVAAALAPQLADGSVVILGESTPEEFERGLGGEPALQRLFDRILVEEATVADTRDLLNALRLAERPDLGDDVLRAIQEASESFLGHLGRPGGAATLLRSVVVAVKDAARPVTTRDVFEVLSTSTGIPVELLDDGQKLDLERLRNFFDQRIIGQPEAVSAVMDAATLIKSGLTDPGKPFSVMLFVGPTGVGKTELARALAEAIFGDVGRLLRFDMSEFASPESFVRLIGAPGEPGLLTDAVKQRPFSVLLLDEIEKSHLNVFDLCLQLFDAGRLTDGRGHLVDFRKCVVILTSNVGAGTPAAPIGFGRSETSPAAERDRTFRELSRVFRPEFLNRLDRIVQFQALSLESAERIARRELDQVLKRSGVVRRQLTMDLDPEVLSLLVKRGYSAHFGARPLKRTVETHVVLPLARAISTGRTRPGSVVHLGVEEGEVRVRIVPPAAGPAAAGVQNMPAAVPSASNPWVLLGERLAALESAGWPSPERKTELVARTAEPGFFMDHPRRDATFDELHRIEEFLSRRRRLREAMDRVQSRETRADPGAALRDLLDEVETELGHLEFIIRHPGAEALADAWVVLTRVQAEGESAGSLASLVGAYEGMSTRRQFQVLRAAERHEEPAEVAVLLVQGLGATALFSGEAGLHEFHHRVRVKNARIGREQTRDHKALVRVDVFPAPPEPPAGFATSAGIKVSARAARTGHLLVEAPWRVTAFHEPSVVSLDLWFPGTRAEALKSAGRLLHAQVQRPPGAAGSGTLVRCYELGIGSRIKDLRTGRSTTRIAQFFQGRIDFGILAGARK